MRRGGCAAVLLLTLAALAGCSDGSPSQGTDDASPSRPPVSVGVVPPRSTPRDTEPAPAPPEGAPPSQAPSPPAPPLPSSPPPSPSASPPASSPPPAPPPTPATSATRRLDVSVWDRTVHTPPRDVELLVNGTAWRPDLRYQVDGPRTMGTFPVGANGTLIVRPDGVASNECRVPFQVVDSMVDGTNEAETTVEVRDTQVVVFGAAIPGDGHTCPR